MLEEKLAQLGWELKGSRAANPEAEVAALEAKLGSRLPATYRKMLVDYGGELFLGNGALFRPEEPTPWNGEEEDLDLISFLGVGDYHTTLAEMIDDLVGEQLPEWVIPIGESSGGNLLCLAIAGDDKGAVYFWDFEHSERIDGLYRVAPSFDAFLEILSPDPEANVPIEELSLED